MVAAESFHQALAPHARAGAGAAKPDAGGPALGQTKHGLQLRRDLPGPDPTTAKAGLGRRAHHEHAPRPVQDRPPPNPQAWAGWRRGDRRQAQLLGSAIVFFVVAGAAQVALALWGVIDMPILTSLFFLGIVAAMGLEMSDSVLRALRLPGEERKSDVSGE